MNMKVKVAIAAVILMALVALIVIDQTSTPPTQETEHQTKRKNAESIFSRTRKTPRSNPITNRTTELIFKNPAKETTVVPGPKKGTETTESEVTIKGTTENNLTKSPDRIKAVDIVGMEFEEYEIRPGDTLSSIAARKYGDQNLWKVISNANPGIRTNALRVGKKIKVPARPTLTANNKVIETIAGQRTYTVQPGDTLGGISKKVYNTTKHADRIFEENRSLLESPDQLQVGTKLELPDIPTTTTTTIPPTGFDPIPGEELLGNLIHKVKSNDSLWKIAEKYREGRNILRVIEEIISANPKIVSDNTPLKVGWSLVIPN
ncbi:MAG: LysM peptidoglycan-binding domain-containing protein [Planctomycetota bacterium]|nr:LysM peptidoglycan-binding domain-containing protein [Planctomycetota bacterium]